MKKIIFALLSLIILTVPAAAQQEKEPLLKPGMQAPAFTLPDTAGKEVSLSQFRGRYVLIDFWASWCRDCRKENPELVALAKEYKGKNLAVIGVSLDKEREKWLACIEKDGLSWTQLSDLKGWDSAAAKLYDIHWIPTTVLVGPDGKIIMIEKELAPVAAKLATLKL